MMNLRNKQFISNIFVFLTFIIPIRSNFVKNEKCFKILKLFITICSRFDLFMYISR